MGSLSPSSRIRAEFRASAHHEELPETERIGNTTWFEGHPRGEDKATFSEDGAISMRGRVASARGNVRKGVGRVKAWLKERTIPPRAALQGCGVGQANKGS
jgi:hypothetical protein